MKIRNILMKFIHVILISIFVGVRSVKEAHPSSERLCSTENYISKRTFIVSSISKNQKTTLGRLNFFGDSSDLRFIVEDTEGTMSPGVSYSSLFIFDQKSQELSINNLDFVGISVGDLIKAKTFQFAVTCHALSSLAHGKMIISVIFEPLAFENYFQKDEDYFLSQIEFGDSLSKIRQKFAITQNRRKVSQPYEKLPTSNQQLENRAILHSLISNRVKRKTDLAKNDTNQPTRSTKSLSSESTNLFPRFSTPKESIRNKITPTLNDSQQNFLWAFVLFLVLFLLSLLVIGYLIYRLLRIKKQSKSKALSQPYWPSLSPTKTLDFIKSPTNKYDAASLASSFSISSTSNVRSTPRKPEIPHIIPLEPQSLKRYEAPIHEELPQVIPYHSAPLVQQWNVDEIFETLTFTQIHIENWLYETEEKKCGFGKVDLEDPTPCFVKILKSNFQDKLSASDDLASMNQVLHYKSCDHPNLVKFYGFYLSKDNSLVLASEFVPSQSLLNVLVSSRTIDHSAVISTMSGAQLMNFAIGISEAIFYLHGNQVVHGALNASHVKLNDCFTPKLYDCCGENSKRLRLKTCRWSAPEVQRIQQYTEKADVWSFGVLLWEILSLGGLPFNDKRDENVEVYIRKQLQSGGSILPTTRNSTKRLWLLLQSCWSRNPSSRPDISEVKSKLKRMKDATNAITVRKVPGYSFFPTSVQSSQLENY